MTVTKIAGTMDYMDTKGVVWEYVDTDDRDNGDHAVQSNDRAGYVFCMDGRCGLVRCDEGDTFHGDDGEYTVRGGKWTL